MAKTITLEGLLVRTSNGEDADLVGLVKLDGVKTHTVILADELHYALDRKLVTARYWVGPAALLGGGHDVKDLAMRTVMGDAEVCYDVHYSEITGYLWTDEDLKIGGHDLMAEFRSIVGKFIRMEFDIHDSK